MGKISFVLPGAIRMEVCRLEVLPEFSQRHAMFALADQGVISRIVNSLKVKPIARDDFLFPDTPVGTAHVRYRDGWYVFYQRFSADPPLRYSIRLLWCGTCKLVQSRPQFDFEDIDPDA